MVDASTTSFNLDTIAVRTAFEISSNVGIAKLVQRYYGDTHREAQFIKHLKDLRLNLPVNIEINGEASPYIKEANSQEDDWSGITLPWMSIGYEVTVTPLQLLNLYNSVANNGVMMKPYLVSEIRHFDETVEKFKPTVVKRKIASKSTIKKAQELLLGVVERGTAYKLKSTQYQFAGKTGTAQINYRRFNLKQANLRYQASFAGYFPAENPKYSCIVVITNPRENGFYGGDVAGPVFREIADKCFTTRIELHKALNADPKPILANNKLPDLDAGLKNDLEKVLKNVNLKFEQEAQTKWAIIQAENDTLTLQNRNISDDLVPVVTGMGLRDALYILENRGLKVVVSGSGKVRNQSILAGTKIRGQTIRLTLR
jgi:cell division protein FtsI (penicillin-binding protein 3)